MRIPSKARPVIAAAIRGRIGWLWLGFVGLALAAGAMRRHILPRRLGGRRRHGTRRCQSPRGRRPNGWFGPVWTVLYVLMGTAAWLVWRERYHRKRGAALTAYAIQLLLNALWAPLFFG